ncbi:Aldo/keto reductase [Auriscalpium vulgare]|uniref:Aldo/keto reductase n=1 Tax=Auriscalpium vulgare TaxID=40419 RepID=A0ACB8RQ82_9AGAM|nr:Aldo/keto reductase [Auriscalpium vulgare]
MVARIPLVLGGANFGEAGKTAVRVSEVAEAQKIIDAFLSKYTELDTARLYGDGTSEGLLGKVDIRGASIDTKIHPWVPGRHTPAGLRATIGLSLAALHPHKIRTYYLHMPDRSTPFEDTLREVNELYKEGKFEILGLSNYAAWEVVEIVHICKSNGWIQPTVYQARYNAITRGIDAELIPAARKYGIRILAYSPLAGGFLTGRIPSRDTKLDVSDQFHESQGWLGPSLRRRFLNDSQFEALKIIKQAAEKHSIPLVEVGYRWLQHHSKLQPSDGIVIGSVSVEHLQQNLEYAEKGPLPDEVVDALDIANKVVGHDAPSYIFE